MFAIRLFLRFLLKTLRISLYKLHNNLPINFCFLVIDFWFYQFPVSQTVILGFPPILAGKRHLKPWTIPPGQGPAAERRLKIGTFFFGNLENTSENAVLCAQNIRICLVRQLVCAFLGEKDRTQKSCKTKTKNQKITFSNPSNFRYNTLDSCGNGVKREKKTEIFGRIAENCITLFALFLEGPPRKCCLYLKWRTR